MIDAMASVTVLFQLLQTVKVDVTLIKVVLDFSIKDIEKNQGNDISQ